MPNINKNYHTIHPRLQMKALGSFIKFLGDHNLIDTAKLTADGLDFDTRLKIQKYTYLAGKLGLKHEYGYSLYIYGPYSRSLAKDYYALAETPGKFATESKQQVVSSLDQERFLQLVGNKDVGWLEIASTLIDQNPRFSDDKSLILHVGSIKHNHSTDCILSVLSDLKAHRIITS